MIMQMQCQATQVERETITTCSVDEDTKVNRFQLEAACSRINNVP